MLLVKDIYTITSFFPNEEKFGIISQIRRSAVSIPSNIAEGRLRSGEKEFRNFLFIALGSCAELQTQLIISHEIGYIKEQEMKKLVDTTEEIMKMISGFIKKLNTSS